MISLTVRLEQYLTVRRNLGYDLSFTERVLRRFTALADTKAPSISLSICSCGGRRCLNYRAAAGSLTALR